MTHARKPAQILGGLWAVCLATSVSLRVAAEPTAPSALGSEGTASPDARDVARDRYQQGANAYKARRYKDAIDLFLEADRLAPSAALSFNIARAYDQIHDSAGALRWYRDYLRREPTAKDRDAVDQKVGELQDQLRKKGVQQVTVISEPHGATVVVDDRPVGVTPWTGELPPGGHRIALRLRGYADVEQDLAIPPDRAQDVTVRLVPGEAKPTAATVQTAPPPKPGASTPAAPLDAPDQEGAEFPWGTAGWIVLGAGGASLGTALAFELLRKSAQDDARDETVQVRYSERVDSMESRQTAARVFGGVGVGLVLVGGAFLAVDAGVFSGSTSSDVAAGCSQEGCSVVARGRF